MLTPQQPLPVWDDAYPTSGSSRPGATTGDPRPDHPAACHHRSHPGRLSPGRQVATLCPILPSGAYAPRATSAVALSGRSTDRPRPQVLMASEASGATWGSPRLAIPTETAADPTVGRDEPSPDSISSGTRPDRPSVGTAAAATTAATSAVATMMTADSPAGGTADGTGEGPEGCLADLFGAIDRLTARRVDEFDEDQLNAELGALETAARRVKARQTRVVAALTSRRHRSHPAPAASSGDAVPSLEDQRIDGQVRRHLTEKHNWSPSEAKQVTVLGQRLGHHPAVAAAYDAGELPPRNAQLLTETLAKISTALDADDEAAILADAKRQDAVTFGRTCRRLLATLDHDAAMRTADRQHLRRRAAVAQRPDGMTSLSGQWTGLDAEIVHTAIQAFRQPDTGNERRNPEQRTADAIVDALRAALRHAEAPAVHGIRPHVLVTVPYEAIESDTGAAEGHWTGPMPYGEVRRLLDDASISRILTDPAGLPLEAGKAVRNVPNGLYRFLLVRDGGCIAEGCDAPAAWCDVMHLDIAFRKLGRLSPDNAALGCRRHHRLYDRRGWQMRWEDGHPVLRPPPRRIAADG